MSRKIYIPLGIILYQMIEKTTMQRILEHFFTHPTTPIHLRELSRAAKLSMPAILSAVRKLAHDNLVIVVKGRALTTVQANYQSRTFIRSKRLNNIEKLFDSGLVDEVNRLCNPQAVICFGSYSRGEDTERSDVDIAIIEGRKKDLALGSFENELHRKISLHFISMKRVSPEFKANLCNGIVMEGAL
jgi:predicted nucleotidyltransferase